VVIISGKGVSIPRADLDELVTAAYPAGKPLMRSMTVRSTGPGGKLVRKGPIFGPPSLVDLWSVRLSEP
jgi:hypothetical protein